VSDDAYPVHAPGWAAIDRVVAAQHPGQVPHQFASRHAYDLEGNAPLPAISVWEGTGPSHWLYVGYGLSELFEKSSPEPEVSGFGYELTFRLPRRDEDTHPPTWPLALLHGIAAGVLSREAELDSGHLVGLGGPIVPRAEVGRETALHGVICVPDPTLGKIRTPFGSVLFLSLFGLTSGELHAMESWSLERKVGLVYEVAPTVVTDPGRPAFADDPVMAPVYRRHALGVLV
jgi:hypothetical protein